MIAVNSVPIIGQPLAYGLGFTVLIIIVYTESWAGSLVTVAHEGGHMAMALITWRGHRGFELRDGGRGATFPEKTGWGVGEIFVQAGIAVCPCLVDADRRRLLVVRLPHARNI